jgi:hypothetical protein
MDSGTHPAGQSYATPSPGQNWPGAHCVRAVRAPGNPSVKYPGPATRGVLAPAGQYTLSLPQGRGAALAGPQYPPAVHSRQSTGLLRRSADWKVPAGQPTRLPLLQ